MMWGCGGGMGLWGPILMILSTVLFLGLIVYGVVALVRSLDRGGRGRADRADAAGPSAEQLLDNRFAAGEIDEQEYRRRLEILRERTQPASRN